MMYLMAAAALGSSLSNSAEAFSPLPRHHIIQQHHLQHPPRLESPRFPSSTRRYSSSKNDGFLDKVKDVAKSILPKKWFQSEEEKQTAIERRRVEKDVSGGIQTMLKDFPLPVRMLGSMVAPLISGLAAEISEQQRQVEDLLEDARAYLLRDPAASLALGEPITVQPPFSQSSSTISVNGQTRSQTQAAFNVMGSQSAGVARMEASQGQISSLILDVNGRSIRVNLSSSSPKFSQGDFTSSLGKNPRNKGEIIDVEFVEKEEK
jgi:hypothetical protein